MSSIITYQDFLEYGADKAAFIANAIAEHKASELYKIAVDADAYDKQKNTRIMNFTKTLFSARGTKIKDPTSSMIPIPSNLFHRLNTQRCEYSLGNGVFFNDEKIKQRLGASFDNVMESAAYKALIHGVSFIYWASDRLYCFPVTEFVPMYDENTGELKAGIRFWQLASDRPVICTLYEPDGYTKYRTDSNDTLRVIEEKRAYKVKVRTSVLGSEVVGEENYSDFPIIPVWGSKLKQSTLVGIKGAIDNYDMVKSGYADNVSQCAQVYWIIDNCGGMTEEDFSKFRTDLLYRHVANADTDSGVKITPYTNNPPHEANDACLAVIRAGIYEDFGALDVTSISSAARTATEINAAYQALDECADDFEYQIIIAVMKLLKLLELPEEVPQFKRNKIANIKEQVEVVLMEANYLDDETILNLLPNITVDQVQEILKRRDADDLNRFGYAGNNDEEEETNE